MAHQSNKSRASITSFSPDQPKKVEKKEEEWEPQSLEEALLGEPVGDDSY